MKSLDIKPKKAVGKAASYAEHLFTYSLLVLPWGVFAYLIYYHIL